MNLEDIRAELEEDQTWRRDELRFFRNRMFDLEEDFAKNRFRRALILLLYSHYEGFCKFALDRYVRAINDLDVRCIDAVPALVAGSWNNIFSAMESGDQKERIFRDILPNDVYLHRFARRREFVERITNFTNQPVRIPDGTIDTESNLLPVVLKKNLYLIGLDHDAFEAHEGEIKQLLYRRNNIAHGADSKGITHEIYQKIEQSVFTIMDDLTVLIMNAIRDEVFRSI